MAHVYFHDPARRGPQRHPQTARSALFALASVRFRLFKGGGNELLEVLNIIGSVNEFLQRTSTEILLRGKQPLQARGVAENSELTVKKQLSIANAL
mmetsp:Transcript_25741/g.60329  ORF Transcript_25741/g.60329 Transcript_25741/m.60329 type:complete len:96 (+) Transcript_25741:44-331(+)